MRRMIGAARAAAAAGVIAGGLAAAPAHAQAQAAEGAAAAAPGRWAFTSVTGFEGALASAGVARADSLPLVSLDCAWRKDGAAGAFKLSEGDEVAETATKPFIYRLSIDESLIGGDPAGTPPRIALRVDQQDFGAPRFRGDARFGVYETSAPVGGPLIEALKGGGRLTVLSDAASPWTVPLTGSRAAINALDAFCAGHPGRAGASARAAEDALRAGAAGEGDPSLADDGVIDDVIDDERIDDAAGIADDADGPETPLSEAAPAGEDAPLEELGAALEELEAPGAAEEAPAGLFEADPDRPPLSQDPLVEGARFEVFVYASPTRMCAPRTDIYVQPRTPSALRDRVALQRIVGLSGRALAFECRDAQVPRAITVFGARRDGLRRLGAARQAENWRLRPVGAAAPAAPLGDADRPPFARRALDDYARLCGGGPARARAGFVRRIAIDGDGRPDFLLDFAAARCADGRRAFCGRDGCRKVIYLARPGGGVREVRRFDAHSVRAGPGEGELRVEASGRLCRGSPRERGRCALRIRWAGGDFERLN
ncbi:MAG: hypothetical protein AAFR16_11175 [Pseudomonadota bacterium]